MAQPINKDIKLTLQWHTQKFISRLHLHETKLPKCILTIAQNGNFDTYFLLPLTKIWEPLKDDSSEIHHTTAPKSLQSDPEYLGFCDQNWGKTRDQKIDNWRKQDWKEFQSTRSAGI